MNVSSPSPTARTDGAPERELDDVIHELGQRMVRAERDGDPAGARMFLERMNAARASRTPEHQARLDAQDRAMAEELTMGGDWTAEILTRAATHFDVPARAVRRRMGRIA